MMSCWTCLFPRRESSDWDSDSFSPVSSSVRESTQDRRPMLSKRTPIRQIKGTIYGVFYTCELFDDEVAMKKTEIYKMIEDYLRESLSQEKALIPAVLLLYTFNKKNICRGAVETICKYLQDIIDFPDEEEYRRICVTSKAFEEKVTKATGGLEILLAVGFEKIDPSAQDYLHISKENANTEKISAAIETILSGQPIPIKVSRNTKAFKFTVETKISAPNLPEDFYLTAEERVTQKKLKQEQLNRVEGLQTGEMRERNRKLKFYEHKYALIRVVLPDYVIQGTFGVYEPIQTIRQWVIGQISHPEKPFTLQFAQKILENLNDRESIGDRLAPYAVLNFKWLEAIDGPSLKESLLAKLEPAEESFVDF